MRYIIVLHYHYDSTEPVNRVGNHLTGEDTEPLPTYGTRAEAERYAGDLNGPTQTAYVWAVRT